MKQAERVVRGSSWREDTASRSFTTTAQVAQGTRHLGESQIKDSVFSLIEVDLLRGMAKAAVDLLCPSGRI